MEESENVKLKDSIRICRLCGLDRGPTESIFEHPDDDSLDKNISFFLPIEVCY